MDGKIEIGGLYFDDLSKEEALERLFAAARKRIGCYVTTPNASISQAAFDDDGFRALLNRSLLVLPDGAGVTAAAKKLGRPFRHGRQAGVAFGEAAAAMAASTAGEGLSLYFLGGKEGVAARAAAALSQKYPSLSVAGCHNGYFDDEEAVLEAIQASGASLLFCCLGSPRQEYFAERNASRLALPVLCLGGSLDIYAGDKKRAPRPVQRAGCEWLWRTLAEPARIRRLPALFAFASHIRRLKSEK